MENAIFKKSQVVMLATNEKANIYLNTGGNLHLYNDAFGNTPNFTGQHLYIFSDEQIKEGDWCYEDSTQYTGIVQASYNHNSGLRMPDIKKIIATTDESISIVKDTIRISQGRFDNVYPTEKRILPQPSQSFIEKFVEEYNKGNVITEVLVEYESEILGEHWYCEATKERNFDINPPLGKIWIRYWHDKISKLKINTTDNTITIKKVKDSWTRDEVEKLLEDFGNHLRDNFTGVGAPKLRSNYPEKYKSGTVAQIKDNWIEENL